MTAGTIALLALVAGLGTYLFYVMLRPERF